MNSIILKKSSRYDSIDGMRLIMAFMVAVLHVGMPLDFCGKYMADIARNAVPFFYVCRAFLYMIYNIALLKRKY